jgi:hypothetical protein
MIFKLKVFNEKIKTLKEIFPNMYQVFYQNLFDLSKGRINDMRTQFDNLITNSLNGHNSF